MEESEQISRAVVLVVDDSDSARMSIVSVLGEMEAIGSVIEARDGRTALEIAQSESPDLVLMDIRMPGLDGIDTTAAMRELCPDLPVVAYSASLDAADVRRCLEAGACGYAVKSGESENLRTAVTTALRGQGALSPEVVRPVVGHYVELLNRTRRVHTAVIESLAAAVEAKDVVTSDHLHRVSKLAVDLAGCIDPAILSEDDFLFGCILHDVGKIGVPEAILGKPGALDESEWRAMRLHPETGARVIEPLSLGSMTTEIVLRHHERWDGKGYPEGLDGTDIPLPARIFAVCDALDAMTSNRPYRSALEMPVALERIRASSGTQFDPDVVATLLDSLENGTVTFTGADGLGT